VRERIKAVATDLFIAHGLRGMTFGLLAERLGIPRPNVHYYFSNKTCLAEEVLADYAAGVVSLYDAVWTVTHLSLPAKFDASLAAIRERYRRFNPPGREGQPWGLLTRFQYERDSLTPAMLDTLRRAGAKLEACGTIAVRQAVARGELVPETPQAEVALLVTNAIRFTGTLTVQTGGFRRVEAHYRAIRDTIGRAYGTTLYSRAAEAVDHPERASPAHAAEAEGA
jgi:TetR/AcrR family transcriptional regulator, transcriptional repressor for nem operon